MNTELIYQLSITILAVYSIAVTIAWQNAAQGRRNVLGLLKGMVTRMKMQTAMRRELNDVVGDIKAQLREKQSD